MIILYIVLYLVVGLIVKWLIERHSNSLEFASDSEHGFYVLIWPIVLIIAPLIYIFLFVAYLPEKKQAHLVYMKIRKFFRGF